MRLRRLAAFEASLALAITGTALLGYIVHIPVLYAVQSGLQAMSPLTALALAILALAELAILRGSGRFAAWAACLGIAIGAAVLGSHLIAGADVISPTLVMRLFGPVAGAGRTSQSTALALIVLGAAMLPAVRSRHVISDYLAGLALIVAAFAIVGYAYGAADLYSLPLFHTMAINTGVTILLLSSAVIFSQPGAGWAATIGAPAGAGRATRRQLVFTLLPPILGFVLVRAMDAQIMRIGAAMTMLVVLTVAPLAWLVLRDGRALAALERERDLREGLEGAHLATLEAKLSDQAAELHGLNVAALRSAETATQHSESRYRLLFDSIDAGFCVVEMKFATDGTALDYRFLETNAAFAGQTGLDHAEGKWMRDMVATHEQHWFDLYGRVAITQEPQRFELPARDLGDRWYDVHAFPVDDPGLMRVAVLFNDVTDRRRSFAALEDLNVSLEERIKVAVAEVEKTNAVLAQAQKMEAIGQLTGGVAHDFNNLLTPIMGSLDLLHRRSVGSDREQKLIHGALQSAERARVLVQRLLAFARRQPLQLGPVDLASLIAGMSNLIESTVGPQIRVAVEIDPGMEAALGDANQIEMALLNLCVNARDAMPEGGDITIRATGDDPAARTAARPGLSLPLSHYVRLSVTDTGAGMDAETIARATEPFFSTKGVGKGSGLGLSMVEGLVAQLGGGLVITSHVGVGTTMDLWLPESASPSHLIADQGPLAPAHVPFAASTGRALVVDDEVFVRLATVNMLEEMGFEVNQAGTGHEAETVLRSSAPFDLIVTDYLMPGMTGVDLSRIIRTHWPETNILLVSGYAENDGIPSDLPRLNKPFRQSDLAQAVADLN